MFQSIENFWNSRPYAHLPGHNLRGFLHAHASKIGFFSPYVIFTSMALRRATLAPRCRLDWSAFQIHRGLSCFLKRTGAHWQAVQMVISPYWICIYVRMPTVRRIRPHVRYIQQCRCHSAIAWHSIANSRDLAGLGWVLP